MSVSTLKHHDIIKMWSVQCWIKYPICLYPGFEEERVYCFSPVRPSFRNTYFQHTFPINFWWQASWGCTLKTKWPSNGHIPISLYISDQTSIRSHFPWDPINVAQSKKKHTNLNMLLISFHFGKLESKFTCRIYSPQRDDVCPSVNFLHSALRAHQAVKISASNLTFLVRLRFCMGT